MVIARRSFLGGMFAALAAPAIVSYKSIMPVKLVRWVERPRGIQTFESYPWVATINYDEQNPYHINLDQIEINSAYIPGGFDSKDPYHAPLNGFIIPAGATAEIRPAPARYPSKMPTGEIMKLEKLDEVSRGTYNWVDMKDMRYAKPKVIK